METKPKQKAKRVIKELDFSGEGCAVSLVGPSVQGAANGFKTLVFKSTAEVPANKESNPIAVEAVVADTSNKTNEVIKNEVSENDPVIVKQTNKENNMDEIVELQKSLEDQKQMLTKALEQIKTFEAEKKEAISKSRKAEVLAAVKDEDKVEVLFKAVAESSDEDFKAVVKALSELTAAVDKSDLFVEKGVQLDNHEGQPVESAVMKAAKARIAKAAK